jgi:GR25 family glycosyltransferase involved in LPS biosynthesis
MISTDKDLEKSAIRIDQEYFWALTKRNLTLPEIGCAYSHNVARRECAQLEFGGVILEDDARIVDVNRFASSAFLFLEKYKDTSSILSLTYGPGIKSSKESSSSFQIIELFGDAPLAVAYVVTPLAAKRLFQANNPVKYVSDWPKIKVKNYCLLHPLVSHGDINTQSTIDPTGALFRTKRNLRFTILKLTLLDFFMRSKGHLEFKDYLLHNFMKPIQFRLDSIQFFFIRNFIHR